MSSPVGLTFYIAVILPLAVGGKMGCMLAVTDAVKNAAVRTAKTGGDDPARAAGRTATHASGYADNVARGAARAGARVSAAVWSKFTQRLDEAVAASTNAGRAIASVSERIDPNTVRMLKRQYEKRRAILEAERNRTNDGYQSDEECEQAAARLEKLTEEQAAITRLIERMG